MSNYIFPQSPGLKIERTKTPQWKTITHVAASGKETRTALMSYPRWKFSVSYEFLRSDEATAEYQSLIELYNNVQGGYDTFLYKDPYDYQVVQQTVGTGTGSLQDFQMVRSFGAWLEPVKEIIGIPNVYLDGVYQSSGYTVTNGLIHFNTAPSSGVVVTWSGSYYYRVRFMRDELDLKQFMYDLWESQKVEFISVK